MLGALQALLRAACFLPTTTLGNGETGKPGDSRESQVWGHNLDLNSTAGHPEADKSNEAGPRGRPGSEPVPGVTEHAHRPLRAP